MILRRTIALCFVILFAMMISAPTIIVSCDDSADISAFFGMNEEEEQEDMKLLFDQILEEHEDFSVEVSKLEHINYASNKYHKPYLNLISPPPKKDLLKISQ